MPVLFSPRTGMAFEITDPELMKQRASSIS
jgi:hypothetical protein